MCVCVCVCVLCVCVCVVCVCVVCVCVCVCVWQYIPKGTVLLNIFQAILGGSVRIPGLNGDLDLKVG